MMEDGKFKIESLMNNDIALIILIFSTVLLGAFAKKLFTNEEIDSDDYSSGKIYLAVMVVSVLLFSLSDMILKYITPRALIAVCVITGMVSVELIKKISTLDGLKQFLNDFFDITLRKK
jgi:hypothetical protein